MSESILEILQNRWQQAPVDEDADGCERSVENQKAEGEGADAHGAESPPADELIEKYSCAWLGLKLAARMSVEPEADAQRLIELMRKYPIKPHLNEGGGSGFTAPLDYKWRVKHEDVMKEFSRLWFTEAGDIIIERFGKHMKVKSPLPFESSWGEEDE